MQHPEFYYLTSLECALEGDLESALHYCERAKESKEHYGYDFNESSSQDLPFLEEAVETLVSSLDFARCVRPDGSAYGTRGKCRKGSEAALEPQTPAKRRKQEGLKQAASEMKAGRTRYLAERASKVDAGPLSKEMEVAKSAWKGKQDTANTRKSELDRVQRAYKIQEAKTKEDPSSENRRRMKLVQQALKNEEKSHLRAEKEAEKAAKEFYKIREKNEKMKMSPAQVKESLKIERMIKKMG